MLDRTKEAHPAEQEPVLFESATNTSDNSTILAGAMTWKNESVSHVNQEIWLWCNDI